MTITNVLKFDTTEDVKLLDARGPRFGAAITTVTLAAILATGSIALLTWQLAVFALGAFLGPQATPYAWIYRRFIKPRLRGDVPTEDTRPPQFAQVVGLLFALTAFISLAVDAYLVFEIAIGFALGAAFLNAAFNFCLGCEIYLIIARLRSSMNPKTAQESIGRLPEM